MTTLEYGRPSKVCCTLAPVTVQGLLLTGSNGQETLLSGYNAPFGVVISFLNRIVSGEVGAGTEIPGGDGVRKKTIPISILSAPE